MVSNPTLRPLQSGNRDLLPPAEQALPTLRHWRGATRLLQQVLLGHHAREDRRPRRRLLLLLLPRLRGWQLQHRPVLSRARASCVLCASLRGS
jgi:hypothetical protein